MALMNELKTPSQTVLYGPTFNKTILVCMYEFQYYSLQPFSQDFCKKFDDAIQERNGPKIINWLRIVDFWHQSDERTINAFQVQIAIVKVIAEVIKGLLDDGLVFFKKASIEAIRARCLIRWHQLNNPVNLLIGYWQYQDREIKVYLDQVFKIKSHFWV